MHVHLSGSTIKGGWRAVDTCNVPAKSPPFRVAASDKSRGVSTSSGGVIREGVFSKFYRLRPLVKV